MNFINIILKKVNDDNKNYIYFLFIFNVGAQILVSSILPLSLSADSYQYLGIAEQFDITRIWKKIDPGYRSIGYPLFLYLLGAKTFVGVTVVIIIQSLMTILIPILMFIFLSNNDWKNQMFIAKILTFFISLFPYLHYISSQIMAETLYMFLLVLTLFYLENFLKRKTIESFFYLIFITLCVSLVRPTGVLLFYLIGILIILMLLSKTINFKKFILIAFLSLCSFSIFQLQNTVYAKGFLKFVAFSLYTATGFCNINDQNKINIIKNREWAFVPNNRNYLVVQKDKKAMSKLQAKFIFKEKCLNFNNPGKNTQKYIDTVIDLLNNDEILKKTLTSTYDVKGSPDKPDPNYKNLTPIEILTKVHTEYIFPLPFQHIYWRMSANIGYKETNKIITNVIIETTLRKPEVWAERYDFISNHMNPFNQDKADRISQSGKDMFFWRFIPNPYLEFKNQSVGYILTINQKAYLQNIYTLEKFSGNSVKNIYKKNETIYSTAESYFNSSYKDLIFKNFNIGAFATNILWKSNYRFFNIIKIIILLFIPIFSIYYFLNKLIKKKKINESDYLAIFFTIFGYVGILVSIFFFWDPRHVMMHYIVFLPVISILYSKDKV